MVDSDNLLQLGIGTSALSMIPLSERALIGKAHLPARPKKVNLACAICLKVWEENQSFLAPEQ